MKTLTKYNEQIKKTLDAAGVTYQVYGEQIWVNRTSMCNVFNEPGVLPEESSYPKTLELIRSVLPKGVYSTWGFKNDDEIILEVYE